MLDLSTQSGRLMKAALDLAAAKPWANVTLAEIAEAAGLGLDVVRGEFGSKSDLLARLLRTIDDAVVRTAPKPGAEQSKRDALFEVIMTRLDLLAPYKAALKSIHASGSADFSLAAPYLASQHWMLQAAGIGTDGIGGGVRVAGLAVLYAQVFRTWLADDDAGQGKTMAALDRHLRRGERALNGVQEAGAVLGRFGKLAREAVKAARPGRSSGSKPESPAAGTQAPGPAPSPDTGAAPQT